MSHDSPPPPAGNGSFPRSDRARRRKLGIVYTPEQIVDYIARHTIYKVIPYPRLSDPLPPGDRTQSDLREKQSEMLPKLRILDPACGDGAFLLAAAQILFQQRITTILGPCTDALG